MMFIDVLRCSKCISENGDVCFSLVVSVELLVICN